MMGLSLKKFSDRPMFTRFDTRTQWTYRRRTTINQSINQSITRTYYGA